MSTRTGRVTKDRHGARGSYCHGCHARIMVGEPRESSQWTSALDLSDWQIDLLLMAAAEYEEVSEDAQTISNAVEFIDWITSDVLPEKVHPVDQRIRRAQETQKRMATRRAAFDERGGDQRGVA